MDCPSCESSMNSVEVDASVYFCGECNQHYKKSNEGKLQRYTVVYD